MKFEQRIKVTPYLFYGFAQAFFDDLEDQGQPCFFFHEHWSSRDTKIMPGITPLYAKLRINKKHTLEIRAVATGHDQAQLKLECADADWPEIQPWWEQFKTQLIQEGIIEVVNQQDGMDKRTHAPQQRTQEALDLLQDIRRQNIRDGYVGITKVRACQEAGITLKTAKNHLPELWAHWNEPDYREIGK